MKSRFTYTLALLLILATAVVGLARRSLRERRSIRREIKAYFAANVLPVLLALR